MNSGEHLTLESNHLSFDLSNNILFSGQNQVISNSNSTQLLQPDDRQHHRARHQAETSPVAEDLDEVFHPARPNTMDGTLTPVSDMTDMSETQLTTRSVTQTGDLYLF